MRRRVRLSLVFVILSTRVCLAHEPELLIEPKPVVPHPVVRSGEKPERKIEHLLKAADHLEAAGLPEEAAGLRREARSRALADDVIARKEAELECLQEEINQLRALTGQSQSVLVRLVAVEFSRSKLGNDAARFDALLGLHRPESREGAPRSGVQTADYSSPTPSSFTVVDSNPADQPLFHQLRKKGLVSVLAEPTLIGANGRPANFLSGGQVPVKRAAADGTSAVQWVPFGVQFEFVPTIRSGRSIRLQTRFEISDKHPQAVSIDGQPLPQLTSRSLNTETELQSGQTLVIGRLSMPKVSAGAAVRATQPSTDDAPGHLAETELIVFISPELMDSPRSHRGIEPIPMALDPDELRKVLSPPGVPDDVQYFPPSPVPRRGTVR